jgi:hypothetical protein
LLNSRAAQYLPAQLVPFMHGAGELRSRWPASEISCHVGLVCDACPIGAKAWCSRNRIVIACRPFVDLARRLAALGQIGCCHPCRAIVDRRVTQAASALNERRP